MSKEFLEIKSRKELLDIARELKIVGRWDMNKSVLIDAILRAKNAKNSECKNVVNEDECPRKQSANDENEIDNLMHKDVETESKDENESVNVKIDMGQKMTYIENVEIGTIVAFRLSNGRVKSAKVTRKSTKNRKLKLETDYGAEYIVSYDDIVWVRTGKRWPRGVYKLLKGQVDANGKEKIKA